MYQYWMLSIYTFQWLQNSQKQRLNKHDLTGIATGWIPNRSKHLKLIKNMTKIYLKKLLRLKKEYKQEVKIC